MTMTEEAVEAPPEKRARKPRAPKAPKPVAVVVGTSELREAVRIAGRASAKTSGVIPAWRNLRLEARAGTLSVTGYNGYLSITHTVALKAGKGSFVASISAGLLARITTVCPAAAIEIKVTAHTVEIHSGELHYELHRGADEFLVPEPPQGDGHTVSGIELADALGRVLHAYSTDNDRPLLTGVQFNGTPGILAATDSYVLAIAQGPIGDLPQMVVPGGVLREVVALFGSDDEVSVRASDRLVAFDGPSSRVTASLIEGDFPPWQALDPDPAKLPASFTVARLELVAAVRAVAVLAESEEPVRLEVSEGAVLVTLVGVDVGSGGHRVEATDVAPGFVTALNPTKLLNVLGACDGDFVTVLGTDHLKPVLIHDGRVGETRAIVMPVRVN